MYLASDVKDVKFSDTSNGNPLQVMLTLKKTVLSKCTTPMETATTAITTNLLPGKKWD